MFDPEALEMVQYQNCMFGPCCKIYYGSWFFLYSLLFVTPVRARGLSRECVLRIPSVSKKATNWGDVSESPYKKAGPVSYTFLFVARCLHYSNICMFEDPESPCAESSECTVDRTSCWLQSSECTVDRTSCWLRLYLSESSECTVDRTSCWLRLYLSESSECTVDRTSCWLRLYLSKFRMYGRSNKLLVTALSLKVQNVR